MIKFSKLFLLAAAGMTLFGSCSDDDTIVYPDPVLGEHVSINPASFSISSKGGDRDVMVTSNGEWTLSAGTENGYVTPSAVKGVDGDIVTFEVAANDKHEDQVFTYVFKNGEKTANCTITLLRKALDELTLTFDEGANNVSHAGGEVKVIVVSNNPWTLEGTSEFVTPSATQGEDGAEVTFTVQPNEGDVERVATFQFKNGEKVEEFKITQAAYVETIELEKSDVKLTFAAVKKYTVPVKTNVDSRDLKAEIPAEAASWVKYKGALSGAKGVEAYFEVSANRGTESRTAAVTLKGVKAGQAVLNITQLPEVIISVTSKSFSVKSDATAYSVEVTANVEYDVTVSEAGNGWCTFKNIEGNMLNFETTALEGETPRTCEVTLTEKNPADNAESPVTVTFNLVQKPMGLINSVADMRKSRCHFAKLNNPSALRLQTLTLEALVNLQEVRENSISTIFGVENHFLLRMGDAGLAWNQLQLATMGGNCTDPALKLTELDKWYHIAVTYEKSKLRFYIDGKMVYEDLAQFWGIDFGRVYNGSETDRNRAFWIGYAYNSDRYFPGYMSEIRVWNRALSAEEINAENHFYSVDPNADGLVGYWKLNGTDGKIVKDYSPSKNDMEGEINVRHHREDDSHRGEPGMNWVETSLP